jgi:hypothetical protein
LHQSIGPAHLNDWVRIENIPGIFIALFLNHERNIPGTKDAKI